MVYNETILLCTCATVLSASVFAKVADPTGVRYAWSDNPVGATLVGARAQIPVFPFQWKKSPRPGF